MCNDRQSSQIETSAQHDLALEQSLCCTIFIDWAVHPGSPTGTPTSSPTSSPTGTQKSSQNSSQKIVEIMSNEPDVTILELSNRIGIGERAIKKEHLDTAGRRKNKARWS